MNKQKNATNPSSFSIINFEGNIENNSAFTNPDQHSNSMSQSESQSRSMSQPQSISQSRSMSNSDDYDTPYSTESISNQYNQKLSLQSYSNKDTSNTNNSINTEPLNSASKNNTFNSELPSTDFEPPKSVPTSSNLTLNTSHELSDTTLTLLHNTNIGPSTMPLYYRNHQHPLFDRNIIITAQQSPTTILPQAIKLSHSKSNQEKPYRCNHCKTSFARFHDLKRHSKKHTQDPKTHYCKDCDKSFARKDSLMRHLNRLTTDGKLSCLKKNLESKWVDAFVKGQNLRNNHNTIHSNESMADEQNCDKNAHANEDSFETSDTTSRVSKEIDLDKVGSKARVIDLKTVEYKASVMDLDDKVFYRDDHEMDILMDLNEEVNEDEEMILLPTHQYHTQKVSLYFIIIV